MRWALTLSGEHVEGVEARSRFDAIVVEFREKLHVNGFLSGFCERTLDGAVADGAVAGDVLDLSAPTVTYASVDTTLTAEEPYVPEFEPEAYGPPEPEEEAKPINVMFASDEAGELAILKGLTTRNFQGLEPSSANGYTVPDVKKAAKRAGK